MNNSEEKLSGKLLESKNGHRYVMPNTQPFINTQNKLVLVPLNKIGSKYLPYRDAKGNIKKSLYSKSTWDSMGFKTIDFID